MDYTAVNKLMNNRTLRSEIIINLTNIVKSINFKENDEYKFDLCHYNNEYGVLQMVFGQWVWSWMMAINSNNSCIKTLINDYNSNSGNKLTLHSFENDWKGSIKGLMGYLESNKDIIFNPSSRIFNSMKYDSQYSWNMGKISEFSTRYTIKQNYPNVKNIDIDYRRGLKEDRSGGKDFELEYDNKIRSCQNKYSSNSLIAMDGDYWYFKKIYYNNETYRNVDDLFIDDSFHVYHFQNSNNTELCGMFNSQQFGNVFRIIDNLKIKRMKKENQDITDLLIELNKYTHEKQIEFHFIKDENSENILSLVKENGVDKVKFILNDFDDEELPTKISNFIEELKQLL
jgi:hypothetical protein